jgi:hypothetical protein
LQKIENNNDDFAKRWKIKHVNKIYCIFLFENYGKLKESEQILAELLELYGNVE